MIHTLKELLGFTDDFAEYDRVLLPTTRGPEEVTAAEGSKVKIRKNGKEKWVIDATSQVGTNPIGHRHPAMMDAMKDWYASEQPLMLAGNDTYHPLQKELAEAFTDIYPGDQRPGDIKTYFCNSGSEAVERGCLKSAQLYKGGNTYISAWNAFHGRTSLALSCNFSKAAHTEGYNSLFRTLPIPFPDPEHDCETCLDALENLIIREGADNINAVLLEPIQGEGGYNVPHPDFLPRVRELTLEHDIPLVMDEVQASLRTGKWFACENWDIEPDMISVAKAFSGGVTPFGASLIKDEYATEQTGKHSSTFGGNPKECYAALKTIEIIQENNYLEHAQEMGGILEKAWNELVTNDTVLDARGIGLMRGIQFDSVQARDAVLERLFTEHNIWTMSCGNDQLNPSIRFLLPVNVEKAVIQEIGDAVVEAVDYVG